MSALAVVLLAVGLGGALLRPRNVPAWSLPLAAAVVAIGSGVVDGSQLHDVLRPLAAPLAFVLVAVPLAVSLDRVGVFGELAALAARSRHVVGALWILAFLVVALLNLDAAVVLLTPLYIQTALLIGVDPVGLAFQPVLLASLASSVLVVSNLTNLIAAEKLSLHNADFLGHLALPSLVASAVGWFAYRRVFPGRARVVAPTRPLDRRALVVGLGAIALFAVLLLAGEPFGVRAWTAALVTEVALIGVTRAVPWRQAPIGTVVLAGSLAVLAAGVAAELPDAFTSLGAGGVKGFAAAAASANVLNNLPAVLVGLTHVSTPERAWPLLLGMNIGPVLVLTGSLAGLLWQASARQAGVDIAARTYSRVGLMVGIPSMLAAVAVLRLLG
ncbi:MAG TPA: SLC13 family permease [Acidimicrobiia bacterium]|nr:SLC13 family permease [Acidimicrobiia bacterium]